jgi:hypothetical protein
MRGNSNGTETATQFTLFIRALTSFILGGADLWLFSQALCQRSQAFLRKSAEGASIDGTAVRVPVSLKVLMHAVHQEVMALLGCRNAVPACLDSNHQFADLAGVPYERFNEHNGRSRRVKRPKSRLTCAGNAPPPLDTDRVPSCRVDSC